MRGLGVTGVTVQFGGLTALEDVSFEVPEGAIVGVIGPNGAGKTTLFNVITGFVRPTRGVLTWDDRPFRPVPHRLVRQGISRTLQAVGLFPHLTALENVMVGAATHRRAGVLSALAGLSRSDRDEARLRADAHGLLEQFEIGEHADRLPGTLPYPVQKRIALARALISRPRLLLLDEPAGGLGAEDLTALAALIRSLPAEPDACSVLLVEHHMDLVMDVCDQVVVLDFGRLVTAGTPDEVSQDPQVAEAYLGVDVPVESLDDRQELS